MFGKSKANYYKSRKKFKKKLEEIKRISKSLGELSLERTWE